MSNITIRLENRIYPHRKFYEISILAVGTGSKYNVTTRWGKIGGKINSRTDMINIQYSYAINYLNKKVDEKKNKGYIQVDPSNNNKKSQLNRFKNLF